MKFRPIILIVLTGLVAASCDRFYQPSQIQIQREDLFTLDIGAMEDQLALFNFDGTRGMRRTDLTMREGLMYISDGNGGKILRFNSYGDLLFMIYNQETNPPPLSLPPLAEGTRLTRWAVQHPLAEPGKIAVDSRNNIFVHDRLPYERRIFDTATSNAARSTASGALLDNVILHFDSEGRFIDYLGREGVGGTPFPRVEGLFATLNDEIAVVTRVPDGWNIYWYDSAGKFIFVVQLDTDAIPVPPERENVFASVDMISAGPNARKLYTKIEYYRNIYDDSTNAILGIEPDSSVIWIMNAETGVWETFVDVPFFEETTVVQNRRIISRKPYSFVGVTKSEQVFLIFPMEGGYSLRIISLSGGGQQRRAFIEIDNGDMQFNAFDLSPDGILTGLLADDWQVKVVWWRTDRFSES